MLKSTDRVYEGTVYRYIDFDLLDGKPMAEVLNFLESEYSDLADCCEELEFVFETSFGELERTGVRGKLL